MEAAYVFRVRFRLDANREVSLDPATFETRVTVEAPVPGEDGWLFFRDVCWRGEVNDEAYVRRLFTDRLGAPVESVSFAALHLDPAYRERFHEEIAADLGRFNANSVAEVISKYLGSSVEVVGADDESDAGE